MYTVEAKNKGDGLFYAGTRGYEFVIDPAGKAFAPTEVLLASLGSCVGFFVRRYAEGTKLAIGEFGIKVESELSEEKPMAMRDIRVFIDLKGAALDEPRKKALLSFIANCPIRATLDAKPEVKIAIV